MTTLPYGITQLISYLDMSGYGEKSKVNLFRVHESILYTHVSYDGQDAGNVGVVGTKD